MTETVDVLSALANGEWEAATATARLVAAQHPDSRLAHALAGYLTGLPAPGVYDEPSAFEAFIDNAGNVGLYRKTIQQLSTIHEAARPRAVLDIGCGDGRVTASVVGAWTTRIDLVEPSADLLARATRALDQPGTDVAAHRTDAATYLADADADADTTWDLVQSTFALHATRPAERPTLFRQLARRTTRLVVVEFDVPPFADRSREHAAYLADRYEHGIREYREHPDVVAKFLMPVLVGQLDPTRERYTFEQPIEQWTQLLHAAGFTTATRLVDHYWWANATLIDATTAG